MAGTISRGIRTPIIRAGDDLVNIIAESVLEASKEANFEIHDRDIIAATEAIVAITSSDIFMEPLFSLNSFKFSIFILLD